VQPSDFIAEFFAHTEGSFYFCSLANERKNGARTFELAGRGGGVLLDDKIHRWDLKDRGTFFCVNTITPNQSKRSRETIHQIGCLHADLDLRNIDLEPDGVLACLDTFPLAPSMVINSGHGFHAYWILTEGLDATAELKDRVTGLLKRLADVVGGDPAVAEIARLMRLPGSYNTKGGDRLPVTVIKNSGARYELDDLAEWLAEQRPVIPPRKAAPAPANAFLGVELPCACGPATDIPQRLAAMRYRGEGDSSIHATQLACTAAMLNRGEAVDDIVLTVTAETRRAAGATGARWNWAQEERDIRQMCEAWARKKLALSRQNEPLTTFEELGAMQFEPTKFLVPDLIPAEGVTLICSKPKAGKSWLCLDLVLSVAMDRDCLGGRRPLQGNALLLALEDSKRRLRSRGEKLLAEHFGAWPRTVAVATQWPRVDQDGLDRIRQWALDVRAEGKAPVLVVIDVLKMVRPSGQEKKTIYAQDYEALQGLRVLAQELSLAIVVTHHVRKTAADDAQDTISGSLGLSASADCTIVLERQPDGNFVLDVRGRDVEHVQLAATFSKETCQWSVTGDAAAARLSETRRAILSVLTDADDGMTPAEIATAAEIKPNHARVTLFRMAKDGEIRKDRRGRYTLTRERGPP
jgi:hypothetical protein